MKYKDFIVSQMTVVEEDVKYYIDQLESNKCFAKGNIIVITAYRPNLNKWKNNFKARKV